MGERVVIYARGTIQEIALQRDACLMVAHRAGQQVVAFASDGNGDRHGWDDANRMVAEDRADRVLVDTLRRMPPFITSATQEIRRLTPGRRPRRT